MVLSALLLLSRRAARGVDGHALAGTHPAMEPDEEQSFSAIEHALKRAAAALREADVPFLLGGSLASWARGGPETRHDLDLMIKPEDAERALEALQTLTTRHPEQTVLVVTHGGVIGTALASWFGAGPDDWRSYDPHNCAVSVLEWDEKGWRARLLNDITHLPPEAVVTDVLPALATISSLLSALHATALFLLCFVSLHVL